MGHWMWGMFASPGRSWGACAVHSLWQQKDCQRCLWWVSHAHTHTLLCSQTCGMLYFTRLSLASVFSKIKVWDLQAALDPRAPASTLCLRTLVVRDAAILFAFNFRLTWSLAWRYIFFFVFFPQEHSGRVFRLQFDEFQIISSSHDDTILIWDFLNVSTNGQPEGRSPSRTYTYISR